MSRGTTGTGARTELLERAAAVGVARARLALIVVLTAVVVATGCSYNAPTADTPSLPQEFTFVSPGGQTRIFYDPPEQRGAVRGLSGESLLEPGRTIGLDDFSGQVVVLNVWGAWCGPCREEMPALHLIHEQIQPAGVTLLGIDVRDDRDARLHDRPRDHLPVDLRQSGSVAARTARLPPQHSALDDRAGPLAPGGRGVPHRGPGR